MQIFISYSRIDKAFAQRLADDLTKREYKVWLDLKNIASGANWDLEVQRGLDNSDTMLVLLSPSSSASQNVADEWSYFAEKGKRIIPLMIQPCDVPFRLSRRQRVDFVQSYDQGLTDLLRALNEPAPTLSDGKPATDSTRPLRVSWAARYHWWSGLRPVVTTGEASVTNTDVRLLAARQLPFVIPLTSFVSAQVVRLPWDTYLSVKFLDRADQAHELVITGTERATREMTDNELLSLIKLHSGRALS